MAKMKDEDNTKCWQGGRETRLLWMVDGKEKMVMPLWKYFDFFFKSQHQLLNDPALEFLGNYYGGGGGD